MPYISILINTNILTLYNILLLLFALFMRVLHNFYLKLLIYIELKILNEIHLPCYILM